MRKLAPLFLIFSCFAASGCVRSTPGTVHVDADNPIVTVGGGTAEIGGANSFRAWYYIDRATQTCWMEIGVIGGAVDCCRVRLVPEAHEHIAWETDASCAGRVAGATGSSGILPPAPVAQ